MSELLPVNNVFASIVGYITFRMIDINQSYNETIPERILKMTDCIRVKVQTSTSNIVELISILIFLATFKAACDTNLILEGAAT